MASKGPSHRIGNLEDVSGLLLDQQQSHAPVAQFDEDAHDLLDDQRRQTERGFVSDQYIRGTNEQRRQGEYLLFTTGEVARRQVAPFAKDREALVGLLLIGVARQPHREVLAHSESWKDATRLWRQHHAALRSLVGRECRDIAAVLMNGPRGGADRAGEGSDTWWTCRHRSDRGWL